MVEYVPPGWSSDVLPPGSEGWESTGAAEHAVGLVERAL